MSHLVELTIDESSLDGATDGGTTRNGGQYTKTTMKTAHTYGYGSLNPVAESTPEKPSEEESDSNEKPTQTL